MQLITSSKRNCEELCQILITWNLSVLTPKTLCLIDYSSCQYVYLLSPPSALNHRVFAMSDVPIFRNKQRQHIVGSFQFITELNLIKRPGPRYNIYPPEMICSVFETSSLHGLRTLSPSLHSVPNIEIKTMQWSNQCNLCACT